MQSLAWSFLMLLVVVALIPAALWLLKRVQTLQPAGAARQLEVLAQLPVGPRERVLLVRVQQRCLVLGATAQQITLLGEAEAPPPGAPAAPAAGFGALLQRASGR
jgi:flagellar protein FliO/FliZ